jgi:hypothetical protein
VYQNQRILSQVEEKVLLALDAADPMIHTPRRYRLVRRPDIRSILTAIHSFSAQLFDLVRRIFCFQKPHVQSMLHTPTLCTVDMGLAS